MFVSRPFQDFQFPGTEHHPSTVWGAPPPSRPAQEQDALGPGNKMGPPTALPNPHRSAKCGRPLLEPGTPPPLWRGLGRALWCKHTPLASGMEINIGPVSQLQSMFLRCQFQSTTTGDCKHQMSHIGYYRVKSAAAQNQCMQSDIWGATGPWERSRGSPPRPAQEQNALGPGNKMLLGPGTKCSWADETGVSRGVPRKPKELGLKWG